MDTDPRPRVSFTVDDDADAHRISVVLEALGFDAVRSMESSNALHWGIARLVRRYSLGDRERAVLELMLVEQLTGEEMARRLETDVGTVAFLRSQVLVKTGVGDREQLLRLALQLPFVSVDEERPSRNNPPRAPVSTSMTSANTAEPPPATSTGPAIWPLVIDDLRREFPSEGLALVIKDARERDEIGTAKYGTPLQAGNGRRPLIDAYQEALDLAVYLRQAIEEGEALASEYNLALMLLIRLRRRIDAGLFPAVDGWREVEPGLFERRGLYYRAEAPGEPMLATDDAVAIRKAKSLRRTKDGADS